MNPGAAAELFEPVTALGAQRDSSSLRPKWWRRGGSKSLRMPSSLCASGPKLCSSYCRSYCSAKTGTWENHRPPLGCCSESLGPGGAKRTCIKSHVRANQGVVGQQPVRKRFCLCAVSSLQTGHVGTRQPAEPKSVRRKPNLLNSGSRLVSLHQTEAWMVVQRQRNSLARSQLVEAGTFCRPGHRPGRIVIVDQERQTEVG